MRANVAVVPVCYVAVVENCVLATSIHIAEGPGPL